MKTAQETLKELKEFKWLLKIPPPKTPRVPFEQEDSECLATVRSPKSVAFPVVAIAM